MAPPAPSTGSPDPFPRARVEVSGGERELDVCVLATGDTLFAGRAFRAAFPDTAGYAAHEEWYVSNGPISWEGRRYEKFGRPRVLSTRELRPVGQHQGVVLFAAANTPGTPGILYVPTRPGCEFHLYHWDARTGPIRGR